MKQYLVLLRQILTDRFDEEELRTLCFDMGIDYDDLPGRGKAAKARELAAYFERHEQISEYVEVGKQLRPDILWEQVQLAWLEAAQQEAAEPQRFQPLIDELRAAVARGEGRVERQRERIAAGLEQVREKRLEAHARRHERDRVRVVGQPPLDVAYYFKDRQRELTTLTQMLAQPTTRLVSVIGHGGMGKTALACKVLRDIERHRWPYVDEDSPVDGIAYLSTRTAGISLERIFLDCAKLLGSERKDRLNAVWTSPHLQTGQKIARLLSTLSDGRYVILLDNLDDLLDGQGQFFDDDLRLFFDQALTNAGNPKLIVTSRVGLALRRELMRFDRHVKLLQGLPVEDGVALLRDLDPNSDYGLRDTSEERLAEAVNVVHGVPRALEVLAGILANDPFAKLDEILETFYEQDDVVRDLIKENYRRLDRDAQRVIDALAVFRRPVPVLAVDYLLEPFAPGLEVPNVVRRLTQSHTVSVDRDSKKVTLHPIDQDYTYSQLPEEDETESNYTRQALERRAGDYYAQLRTPEEKWESIEDLEPQLNEFEHLVLAGDYDDAGALLETIDDDYLRWWGHYARLVGMREKLQGNLTDGNLQVDNWASLGHAYSSLGQLNRAVGFFKNALTIAREIGNRQEEGVQLGNLGFAYRGLGYFEQAVECHEEAVAIAREISDRKRESRWLSDQGLAYNSLGEIERSIQLYRESLEIAREIGDHWWETVNIGRLGLAYHGLGQIEERAIPHYVRFLAFAREVGNRREEGVGLGWLGIAFYDLGRVERAVRLHQEALDIACEYNIRYYESIWSSYLGLDYSALGESEQALQFYERALAVAEEVGARRCESHHRVRLARTLISTGRFSEARQECAEALALSVPQTIYRAALLLGIVLLHLNDPAVEVAFADTVDHCSFMLEKTSNLYNARYVLATAFLGQVICDPRWTDEATRPELLTPALEEYRRAMAITAAPGVVQEAIRNLELIQAAGIPGLEPVFELLERAEYEPGEDLPDILEYIETEGNG